MACRQCLMTLLAVAVAHGLHRSTKTTISSSDSNLYDADVNGNESRNVSWQSNAPQKKFAQLMCSGFEPKQVAVCFSGAARSFPNQLVHQSVKENLLGGSFGAHMTPFLHVARTDASGNPNAAEADLFPAWERSQIRAVAKFLDIADENINIIDGPNMAPPTCNGAQTSTVLAGTLSHRKGCMDMISAKEQKQGSKFDFVIMARADLTYYLPLRPFCMYNLSMGTALPGRRYSNWFFMVPRESADDLFVKRYKDLYECKKPFAPGTKVEDYLELDSVGEDLSLPVIVTRKQETTISMCDGFKVEFPEGSDFDLPNLCHGFIDKNAYNAYS